MVSSGSKRFSLLRIIGLMLVAAMLLSACGAKTQTGSGKLKVAMILPGPVEDADFNYVGYVALEDMKKAYGVEVKHQERVAPADAERVARGFINDGFNVIAFHGGQFVTVIQKLAPEFPDVNFIAESSGQLPNLPANVWNIGRKFYQGFYTFGELGAVTSKTGKIGIVAGVKLPDFVASINAIQRAARAAKPGVQVLHTFVGDQNDPVKARQAAEAMINEGVDFIIMMVNLGASGVVEAAKGKNVLVTTYYTDKTTMAPQNFAGSLMMDFSTPYKNVLGQIQKGVKGGYEEMRPGNGMALSKLTNVPDSVAKQVEATFQKVVKKEIDPPENITDIEP
jgi:basic membrane protein A and related proteins